MPAGTRSADPGADGLLDVVRVLARDQPEGELQLGRGRDDRLAAGALVAAADAVDLGGRAGPDALQGGVVRPRRGWPCDLAVRSQRVLVEGQLGEELALAVGELGDAVVEAGDRPPARRASCSAATRRAAAVAGLGTAPPKEPEWMSWSGPCRSISQSARPRMPVQTVGVSSDHMPVSETITASAASRSALRLDQGAEVRRAGLLLALDRAA